MEKIPDFWISVFLGRNNFFMHITSYHGISWAWNVRSFSRQEASFETIWKILNALVISSNAFYKKGGYAPILKFLKIIAQFSTETFLEYMNHFIFRLILYWNFLLNHFIIKRVKHRNVFIDMAIVWLSKTAMGSPYILRYAFKIKTDMNFLAPNLLILLLVFVV